MRISDIEDPSDSFEEFEVNADCERLRLLKLLAIKADLGVGNSVYESALRLPSLFFNWLLTWEAEANAERGEGNESVSHLLDGALRKLLCRSIWSEAGSGFSEAVARLALEAGLRLMRELVSPLPRKIP